MASYEMRAALLLVAVALTGDPSVAADINTTGASCVKTFDPTPDILYDDAQSALSTTTAFPFTEEYLCTTPANNAKTLLDVRVFVHDRHPTKPVECTACNGGFCASSASAGSSASIKTVTLNMTDSTWIESNVVCSVPEVSSGLRSGISKVRYTTN